VLVPKSAVRMDAVDRLRINGRAGAARADFGPAGTSWDRVACGRGTGIGAAATQKDGARVKVGA
jgi:hypothetical protein